MILSWTNQAWEDYVYWQKKDKQKLKRINNLVKDILRSPFEGIGDPEPLKHNLSGAWSRRIDKGNRIVYVATKNQIIIAQCRYHY